MQIVLGEKKIQNAAKRNRFSSKAASPSKATSSAAARKIKGLVKYQDSSANQKSMSAASAS